MSADSVNDLTTAYLRGYHERDEEINKLTLLVSKLTHDINTLITEKEMLIAMHTKTLEGIVNDSYDRKK